MYLREERKRKNCPTLKKRCHLNLIVPKLMDRLDVENWGKDDSPSFSILRNVFKSYLSKIPIQNGILKSYTGCNGNNIAVLISSVQNEKCYFQSNITSIILYWRLLMSRLCTCFFRVVGGEWWSFKRESKFYQILKSAEKFFDSNKNLLEQIQ